MVKQHKQIAALVACLTLGASAAFAGTDVSKDNKTTITPEEKVSYISGDLGVTIVNTYFSRGIVQGPQGRTGFDAQPYLDIYFQLYAGKGFVDKVTLNLSFWSNIASDTSLHGGGVPRPGLNNWTEFDWMPGVSIVFAKNFTLTVSYFEFDYPSQGASPQRSINSTLAYDDTDLLGMWALHPHFTYLQELTGNNNTGGGHVGLAVSGGVIGASSKLGQYYELGIAPAFTFMKESKYPLTLTIPVTSGWGSSGFYGTGFGYFSAGTTLSVPLAFIPSGFGSWTASVGGTYYYLGKYTARVNGYDSNSGSTHDAGVASASIGLTF